MRLVDELRQKPLEFASATALILVGVGLSFLGFTGAGALGTAAAALGGALLSYASSTTNDKQRASRILAPELQSASRHLADTASKLSRNIQAYQTGLLEPELALDRLTQLTTSIYGCVNDVNILAGSSPNYQTLVDTVNGCEQMAARLEELTQRSGGPKNELEELREQFQSFRLQLNSAKKSLGDIDVPRKEEKVACPNCQALSVVRLGVNPGDSSLTLCSSCSCKFHVHRDTVGNVITRPWGGPKRIEAVCPTCNGVVPVNYDLSNPKEERFCMNCCSELTILRDGSVVDVRESTPTRADVVGQSGQKQILKCPQCGLEHLTIWSNQRVARGVCKGCSLLLETKLAEATVSDVL
jgi:hypothetical protein